MTPLGSHDETAVPQRRAAGHTPVGLVVTGAGARGAFAAGALGPVLPRLPVPAVLVGTSAGAVTVAALAAFAHLPPADAAAQLGALWATLTVRDVYRSPLRSAPATLARVLAEVGGLARLRLVSLLDTAPLAQTLSDRLDWDRLHQNVASGRVAAVGVITTAARSGRTTVFVERAPGVRLPPADAARGLDVVDTLLAPEHLLASTALPVVFPPARIHGPEHVAGWYVDGGLRLNAPLKPALDLGARSLVVLATHPGHYPAVGPGDDAEEQPDVDDAVVQLLDALLVDRMVEDLHTLTTVNTLVGSGVQVAGYTQVPCLFVGARARGELGRVAGEVYAARPRGIASRATALPDALLRRLAHGDGRRAGDLLSHLYFDERYAARLLRLGADRARQALLTAQPGPWSTPVGAQRGQAT